MDTTRIATGAVLVLVGAVALFFAAMNGIESLPGLALGAGALALTAGTLLIGTSGLPEEDASRQV
jgi:hypothetical protein